MYFISVIIFIALSLICGAGLIGMSLGIHSASITSIIEELQLLMVQQGAYGRMIIFFIGLLILLVLVRFIQSAFSRSRRVKTLKIDTADGQISITLTALEDMIKKTLSTDEIISHIRPRVNPTKKGINIIVKLALRTETNIKEFAEETQERIREKIQNILGREKELKVNIEVRKISFDKKEVLLEEEEETEEEGPFRQY